MTATATFSGRWREAVAARGDAPFLLYLGEDGRTTTWTYAEFDIAVERTAERLVGLGVGPGSSVHLALRNSPSFVAVWLAVARLGAWMVPSDPAATATELAGHIDRTGSVVGLCGAERADMYESAVAESRLAVHTIAVDEDASPFSWLDEGPSPFRDRPQDHSGGASRRRTGRQGGVGWRVGSEPHVQVTEREESGREPGPHDRLAVMFTSGTTSAPKGVELTQANYAFAGDVMAAAAALQPDDRQMVVLPLFHANAQYYSFASAISAGASVALVHRFSASQFLSQAAQLEATCASLFAAPIRMILARGAEPVDGLRLRHCWYAQNLTGDQYEQVAGLLGCRPRQLYGMTETLPAVITDRALGPRPDAMGYPTLGCAVRVTDDGELQVRGVPGETLFAGYLDDPGTTAAGFEPVAGGDVDGDDCEVWFTTGDRARVDPADGRLVFAGRRSDVLKVAGENVSTVEVEAVLAEHPAVLDVAVVGRPDPVRDEVPVAFVVLAPDAILADDAMVDDLLAHAAGRLAKAKRPREIHVVDELPRTSVGKIRKFLLPASGGPR